MYLYYGFYGFYFVGEGIGLGGGGGGWNDLFLVMLSGFSLGLGLSGSGVVDDGGVLMLMVNGGLSNGVLLRNLSRVNLSELGLV